MRSTIGAITFRPELAAELGLTGGTLRDLRDVVLLTGPDGGGETRYLQRPRREPARVAPLRKALRSIFVPVRATACLH